MHLHLVSVTQPSRLDEVRRSLPQAEVTAGPIAPPETTLLVSGRLSAQQLAGLPALSTVVIPFAGLILPTRQALLTRPELSVYNLHHNAAATAEKALELLLAVAKRTVPNDHGMREGSWRPRFEESPALQLAGRTVVVLGYGEIGRRVARACLALDMRVRAVKRSGHPPEAEGVEIYPAAGFLTALQGSDALVCCAPLTDETQGLVDECALASMGREGIVVNVGRGPIFDEEALFRALQERRLFGAGLDVWWVYPTGDEPCEPSSFPFQDLENVVMSPHTGGTVAETESARLKALIELLGRIDRGDHTLRQVDVAAGY